MIGVVNGRLHLAVMGQGMIALIHSAQSTVFLAQVGKAKLMTRVESVCKARVIKS